MKLRKHTRRVHHKKQPASVEHNWQKSEITTKKIRSYRVPVKNLITLLTLRHLGLLPRTDGQKAKCFSYKHSFPKLIWYSRGKLLRFSPAESVLSIMYASFLWLVRHVLQVREIESQCKKNPFSFRRVALFHPKLWTWNEGGNVSFSAAGRAPTGLHPLIEAVKSQLHLAKAQQNKALRASIEYTLSVE